MCVYSDLLAFQGSLEDQLHRLKEYEQGVYAYKPHIEELEKIHQAVQEGMIFENRYKYSIFLMVCLLKVALLITTVN
jgi:hypothetical protein